MNLIIKESRFKVLKPKFNDIYCNVECFHYDRINHCFCNKFRVQLGSVKNLVLRSAGCLDVYKGYDIKHNYSAKVNIVHNDQYCVRTCDSKDIEPGSDSLQCNFCNIFSTKLEKNGLNSKYMRCFKCLSFVKEPE